MTIVGSVVKIAIALFVLLAECVCWLVVGVSQTIHLTVELFSARRRLASGTLRCERGHPVATDGLTWECQECLFRYQGSVWQCENPACHAITPFVYCPVCRLSVRNPYRLEGGHVHEGK